MPISTQSLPLPDVLPSGLKLGSRSSGDETVSHRSNMTCRRLISVTFINDSLVSCVRWSQNKRQLHEWYISNANRNLKRKHKPVEIMQSRSAQTMIAFMVQSEKRFQKLKCCIPNSFSPVCIQH